METTLKSYDVFLKILIVAFLINWIPPVGIIMGLVLLFSYRGREVVGWTSSAPRRSLAFTWAFPGALLICLTTLAAIGHFLGISFANIWKTMWVEGGAVGGVASTDPDVLKMTFVGLLGALIGYLAFNWWLITPNRTRTGGRLLMLCVAYLIVSTAWTKFSAYAPVSEETKQQQQGTIRRAAENTIGYGSSVVAKFAGDLSKSAARNYADAENPEPGITIRETAVMSLDAPTSRLVSIKQTVAANTALKILNAVPIKDTATAILHVLVKLDDERVVWLDNSDIRRGTNHVMPDSQRMAPAPAVVTAIATPVPSVASRSTVKDDQVLVTADGWIDTEVIAYPGDVIELRAPDGDGFTKREDADRLLFRVGGGTVVDIEPYALWDGRFIGQLEGVGGPNIMARPVRLKLSSGSPMSVKIVKSVVAPAPVVVAASPVRTPVVPQAVSYSVAPRQHSWFGWIGDNFWQIVVVICVTVMALRLTPLRKLVSKGVN